MELTTEKSKFNDGFFVRLSKNNRYICFSGNVWANLMKESDAITEALKNQRDFQRDLTKESSVATQLFQGKTYVCFKKNNLYINLDESQWERFKNHSTDLGENVQPTILRYLYTTEHQQPKWFFSRRSLKDYAEKQGLPYRITEKKVPAPDRQTRALGESLHDPEEALRIGH